MTEVQDNITGQGDYKWWLESPNQPDGCPDESNPFKDGAFTNMVLKSQPFEILKFILESEIHCFE